MGKCKTFKGNAGASGGTHGWDDTSPKGDGYEEGPMKDMRAIFVARGPKFKKNYKHQWIKLVDEYQERHFAIIKLLSFYYVTGIYLS